MNVYSDTTSYHNVCMFAYIWSFFSPSSVTVSLTPNFLWYEPHHYFTGLSGTALQDASFQHVTHFLSPEYSQVYFETSAMCHVRDIYSFKQQITETVHAKLITLLWCMMKKCALLDIVFTNQVKVVVCTCLLIWSAFLPSSGTVRLSLSTPVPLLH